MPPNLGAVHENASPLLTPYTPPCTVRAMSTPRIPYTARLKPVTVKRIEAKARQFNQNPRTWLAQMIDDLMRPMEPGPLEDFKHKERP